MGYSLQNAELYRCRASEALDLAAQTEDKEQRRLLLDVAVLYHRLACLMEDDNLD